MVPSMVSPSTVPEKVKLMDRSPLPMAMLKVMVFPSIFPSVISISRIPPPAPAPRRPIAISAKPVKAIPSWVKVKVEAMLVE